MDNNIQEDIKKIECIFEFQDKMSCQYVLETEDEKAIQNILSDYKRVLKELEEKTTILLAGAEKVKQLEKENETLKNFTSSIFNENIEKNYIPIQIIKDLKQETQNLIDNSQGCMLEEDLHKEYGKIEACDELLEKGEKNV